MRNVHGYRPNYQRSAAELQKRWQTKEAAFLTDALSFDLRVTVWTAQERRIVGSLSAILASEVLDTNGGKWNQLWYADHTEGEATAFQDALVAFNGTPTKNTPRYGDTSRGQVIRPYTDILFKNGPIEVGLVEAGRRTNHIILSRQLGAVAGLTLTDAQAHFPVWEVDPSLEVDPVIAVETYEPAPVPSRN